MVTEFALIIIGLVTLFFLFLRLSVAQVKLNLMLAAALFVVPLLITFISALVRSIEGDYISVFLLQGGITSIIFSLGYGICAGLLLNALKMQVISAFHKVKGSSKPEESEKE